MTKYFHGVVMDQGNFRTQLLSFLLCTVGILSGCSLQKGIEQKSDLSSGSSIFASELNVRAPDHIDDAFAFRVTNAEQISTQSFNDHQLTPAEDKVRIKLKKVALEKEFLMQAALIPQLPAATGTGLKSRIVAFRQRGEQLFLMEASQGYTAGTDLPQTLILAEFPVTSQEGDSIEFDFNLGMSKIFMMGDWHGSDFASVDSASQSFVSVPISISYLESAELTTSNKLYIRQIAQVENMPIEVRYWLSPYRPNALFSATESRDFNQFGFFEVAAQLDQKGEAKIFATKFDINKPIVFALSANTPAEFKEAVREGVLYWRKVLGENGINVIDAPVGRTAPDPEYNIIQWVTWDSAGFAYADAQSDPRNGEIQRAQVFFTSVFGIGGKRTARQLLKEIEKRKTTPVKMITLKGMEQTPFCFYGLESSFVSTLRELVDSDATDAKILKAARDYIREVVAHEIGHTLGLRHNFAGSLATNVAANERAYMIKHYFAHGSVPSNKNVSSSVMDYNLAEEAFVIGDQILRGEILDYDKKAIRRLYFNDVIAIQDSPLFCTDSHVGRYVDCQRFDAGSNLVDRIITDRENVIKRASRVLVDLYVASIKAAEAGRREVNSGDEIRIIVSSIVKTIKPLLDFTQPQGKLLQNRFYLSWSESLDAEKIRQDELTRMDELMRRAGGMEQIWPTVASTAVQAIVIKAVEYIETHHQAIYYEGQWISLTSAQKQDLITALQGQLPAIRNTFASEMVALGASLNIPDHPIADEWSRVLHQTVAHLLFAQHDPHTVPQTTTDFMYAFKLRRQSLELVSPYRGQAIDWASIERERLKIDLTGLVKAIYGTETPAVKDLNREQQRNYQELRTLIGILR